jgi:anthranilate synthase component 1
MNKATFKELAKEYSVVPVYKRLLADTLTPVSLFLNLREGANMPFLLESVVGGENLARYSFLGRDPFQVLEFDGKQTILKNDEESITLESSYFDALRYLTNAFTEPEIPDLPRLTGGAVGFSAYDTFRQVEDLPDVPEDDLRLPEAVWAFYDEIYAFDHVKHQIVLIKSVFINEHTNTDKAWSKAVHRLNEMEAQVHQVPEQSSKFEIETSKIGSILSKDHFESMVEKAKNYIYEGDIFQVVLSQRFETAFKGDTFMLYRALRMVNPSPYLFYLHYEDFSVIGSSPEVLVRVQDDEVHLLPIAGTRPRGRDHEEDLNLEQELINDPKEIAEHVMLVDLGRNDLSRVCEAGSVKMERNQVVERYSHVMHIVSDVVGTLREEQTSVDALMQCFPAGTVSGAPKIRAMQIIDEMEPTKRGIYAGAVGYFDYSGNMDTCIAIRTMITRGGKVYIQAGAGIVADSDPIKEFEETQNKAKALIEALSVALDIK